MDKYKEHAKRNLEFFSEPKTNKAKANVKKKGIQAGKSNNAEEEYS